MSLGLFDGTLAIWVLVAAGLAAHRMLLAALRPGRLSTTARMGMLIGIAGPVLGYFGRNWPFPLNWTGAVTSVIGLYLLWRPPDDWWRRRRRRLAATALKTREYLARGIPARRVADGI